MNVSCHVVGNIEIESCVYLPNQVGHLVEFWFVWLLLAQILGGKVHLEG
jgi:hypothetical protein